MRSQPLHDVNEIQAALRDARLDAAVVVSSRNLFCLSGYPRAMAQRPGYRRNACAIAYRDSEPTLVTGRFQEEITLIRAPIRDVTTYEDYVQSPLARAAEVLRKRGLASGSIGIESRFLTAQFRDELVEGLGGAQIVPCDDLLDEVWVAKQPAEIERMRTGLQQLSRAVLAGLEQSRAGETEVEVHRRILARIRESGTATGWGRLVSGPRLSLPEVLPADRRPSPGDLLRIEYGCTYGAYPARVARLGVVGQPDEAASERYRRYLGGLKSALAEVGPDQTGGRIFTVVKTALESAGFSVAGASLGHGMGIGFFERPAIQLREEFRTRPGMVLSVEPETAEGLKVGLTVEIGESGCSIFPDLLPPVEELLVLGV